MNIVFMGTPDFARVSLEKIIEAGHNVVLVVTQPDKEKGRGKLLQESDVKICAKEHSIPVFQPEKIKLEENVEFLRKIEADIFVVAAFGQILSKEILDMPKYGCVNIHASLLPEYRGAAPIQWSIIDGKNKTGVSIQQMDIGVDTGDIISSQEVEITEEETGGSLFDKLAVTGAQLIIKTLEDIEKGNVTKVPQDNDKSTYAKMLTKEMGKINFNKSAKEINCLIRGCNPWPSAYTMYNGKTVKIWEAVPTDDLCDAKPGTVVKVTKDSIIVKCKEQSLRVDEIQLEGKKRMKVHDFLLGYKVIEGEVFG